MTFIASAVIFARFSRKSIRLQPAVTCLYFDGTNGSDVFKRGIEKLTGKLKVLKEKYISFEVVLKFLKDRLTT